MDGLGQKIRDERQKKGLTLEQMSHLTSLSASFLSQVERDLLQPSLNSLKKISQCLGLSLVNLFQDNHEQMAAPSSYPMRWTDEIKITEQELLRSHFVNDVRIVRRDRRKRLSLPGSNVLYELLTPDLNRLGEVLYVQAVPSEGSGEEMVTDPPGDKFAVILKGKMEVTVKDEVYYLETGDAIYHPSHFPHKWRAVGDEPTEAIIILIPPCF
ncbi:MAG: XRE family transcriptional regulator [Pseudomonadota bacterium]